MNDIILVPNTEMDGVVPQVKSQATNEAPIAPLPAQKKLPESCHDIPVNRWIMPPDQHGYIQGNDRDCL